VRQVPVQDSQVRHLYWFGTCPGFAGKAALPVWCLSRIHRLGSFTGLVLAQDSQVMQILRFSIFPRFTGKAASSSQRIGTCLEFTGRAPLYSAPNTCLAYVVEHLYPLPPLPV
jgi:hypothetical protein